MIIKALNTMELPIHIVGRDPVRVMLMMAMVMMVMAIQGNNGNDGNGNENAASDTDATHHYGVNVTLMTGEGLDAVGAPDVPQLGRGVAGARHKRFLREDEIE